MNQYSPKNQQFLLSQLPTASDVRPFKAWKAVGRSVIKGEKALRVWIPKVRGDGADPEKLTETERNTRFVRGPVFDISQTKEAAPRHAKAADGILAEHRHEQAWIDYGAAIDAGDIPESLDFADWYDLREESQMAAIMAEAETTATCTLAGVTVGPYPVIEEVPTDAVEAWLTSVINRTDGNAGTIATQDGVVIAEYWHVDAGTYPPIGGGSQVLDEQETATAASDSHEARITFYTREGFRIQDHAYRTEIEGADAFAALQGGGAIDTPRAWYAATLEYFVNGCAVIQDTIYYRAPEPPAPDAVALVPAEEPTPDIFATAGPAAYRHSSFDPDRRWQRDREEFELDVATLLEKYTPLATTDEQRAILTAELERYMENYQKHYAGIYGAASRTASTMITGRSNFNVSRNQKYMDIEHRRTTEFLEWREKAQAAIKRAILDARTEEQKSDAMTSRLIKWAISELDVLDKIAAAERGDPGVPSWYAAMNKSAFTTSFTGKLHREVKNGNLAEVQACLRWLDTKQQATGKQLITKRNSVWAYLDQQPAEPTPARENVVIYAADGVTVTANHELGRFQIQHDEKPDAETRATLKRHGWRWSPQHTTWQRHLNNATLSNLTHLFPALITTT